MSLHFKFVCTNIKIYSRVAEILSQKAYYKCQTRLFSNHSFLFVIFSRIPNGISLTKIADLWVINRCVEEGEHVRMVQPLQFCKFLGNKSIQESLSCCKMLF